MKRAIAVLGLLLCVVSANAQLINQAQTVSGFANNGFNPPSPFNITFSGLPTSSAAGGTLSLEVFGDFNTSSLEWLAVTMDGVSLGRILDANVNNDNFVGIPGDIGNQYISPTFAGLSFTKTEFDNYLANGSLDLGFSFGPHVSNLFPGTAEEYITATIEFTAVPEPSTFALAAGLLAFGLIQMRRKNIAV